MPGGTIGLGSSSSTTTFGITTCGCGRCANVGGGAETAGARLGGMMRMRSNADAPSVAARGFAM
jgi:hypothetical protein